MPVRREIAMGTLVMVEVLASGREVDRVIAFSWCREIALRCSRFYEESELRRASAHIGGAIRVSPILYEVLQFACPVVETTGGAFDPIVGRRMETHGFDRNHRTEEIAASGQPADRATSRSVELNPGAHTILLGLPLTLNPGCLAKGFAVDLAARELAPFRDYAMDAGSEFHLARCNELGNPWRVGIPHPRIQGEPIATVPALNRAVCSSADYERRRPDGEHHHLDLRTGDSLRRLVSITAMAPRFAAASVHIERGVAATVFAGNLANAAFVPGPETGIELFENQNVKGPIDAADMAQFGSGSIWTHYPQFRTWSFLDAA